MTSTEISLAGKCYVNTNKKKVKFCRTVATDFFTFLFPVPFFIYFLC